MNTVKKLLSILLTIICVLSLTLVSSASNSLGNAFTIESTTVSFSTNSVFSYEEQQALAQRIVSKEMTESTTYNLLCTMFGHKTTTESITVIEHCVNSSKPRCLQSLQEVTACSRCDYVDIVEISSIYIYCCD